MTKTFAQHLCTSFALALASLSAADVSTVRVDTDTVLQPIPTTLWGVFYEDISFSADGGLYPELVRNRSFEDADKPRFWKLLNAPVDATFSIQSGKPRLNAFNRQHLRIDLQKGMTLENEGYWGMAVTAGETYHLSLALRALDLEAPLTARLVSANGEELARGSIVGSSAVWAHKTLELVPTRTDPRARLQLSIQGRGSLFLDMVSLLPARTWKNHGLRTDLAEAVAGLKPGFLRFPGGCWVEGNDVAHMNRWKDSIGDLSTRKPLENLWGYYSTRGLGFHEYLQFAEDLGAEPLFCINVGMSHQETVPLDRMGQWVQDALDAIEYANGPVDSVWGARRAAAGHPAPFNLRYIEVGNENYGEAYAERWQLFHKAIKSRHPQIQLIASSQWAGKDKPLLPVPDIIDDHFYESAERFMQRASHYDKYDRKAPKVFLGEYAANKNGTGLGNLRAAIGEAALMTGLERNSDAVVMASYAPLFANVNHRSWVPDAINFDGAGWYGTPSYYVQKLFRENRGDHLLSATVTSPDQSPLPPTGRVGLSSWNSQVEFKDIKVSAPDGTTLFSPVLSEGNMEPFTLVGTDRPWTVEGGVLKTTSVSKRSRVAFGDRSWVDYDLSLKARKIAGDEGFAVLVKLLEDSFDNQWNIGNWGNSTMALEFDGQSFSRRDFKVETGRWYDLRISVRGFEVKCYLDGVLTCEGRIEYPTVRQVYASAVREASGDVIVKVVNGSKGPADVDVQLGGSRTYRQAVAGTVLSSAQADDENTLEQPRKVFPRTETYQGDGRGLRRTYPAQSLTILRFRP